MIIPMIVFAFSMCATPGPNNIMLTASGANFGFRRTIPHILGIELGMLVHFTLSAFGLGVLFTRFPVIHTVLKIAGSCYLVYLAARIMFSKRKENSETETKPLNIFQAAAFQFLNPKAYIIGITAVSSFTEPGETYARSAILVILVFGIVCIPSISIWAGFGSVISRFFRNNSIFRIFNFVMGGLTAASIVLIIL